MSSDTNNNLVSLFKNIGDGIQDLNLSDILKSKEKASVLFYVLKQISLIDDENKDEKKDDSLEIKNNTQQKANTHNFMSKGPVLNQRGFNQGNNNEDKKKNYEDNEERRKSYDENEGRRKSYDDNEGRRKSYNDKEERRSYNDKEERRSYNDNEERRSYNDNEERRSFSKKNFNENNKFNNIDENLSKNDEDTTDGLKFNNNINVFKKSPHHSDENKNEKSFNLKENSVNEDKVNDVNNKFVHVDKNRSRLLKIINQNKISQNTKSVNCKIPDFNFIPTTQYKNKLFEYAKTKNLTDPEYSSHEKVNNEEILYYAYVKVGKFVYFTTPDLYLTSEEAEFNVARKAYSDLKENEDKYFTNDLEEELVKLFNDKDEIFHGTFFEKMYKETYKKDIPENYFDLIKDSKKLDIQKHIVGNSVLKTFALRKLKQSE